MVRILVITIISLCVFCEHSSCAISTINNLSHQLDLLHRRIVQNNYDLATDRLTQVKKKMNQLEEKFKGLYHKKTDLNNERKDLLLELGKIIPHSQQEETTTKISLDPKIVSHLEPIHQGLK